MVRLNYGVPFALLVLGAGLSPAAEPSNAATLRLVDSLLQTPDEKLNIGDAALELSRLRFPDADVQGGRRLLDGIAARVSALVGNSRDPDLRIRVINTVLFRELGFSYDLEAMDALVRNERPELRTLSHLLRTHRGNCSSLPVLWFAIAERLRYPVYMVSSPQHLFLRYDDGTYRSNIEATSGGGESTDAELAQELGVPEEGIRSGAYMRELSKRELLGVLVGDAVAPWISTDTQSAIQALEAAAVIAPRSVEIHWQLSAAHELQARRLGSEGSHQRALSHATEATRLGAAEPLKEGYWERLLEKRTSGTAAERVAPTQRARAFDVVAWLERSSPRNGPEVMPISEWRRRIRAVRILNAASISTPPVAQMPPPQGPPPPWPGSAPAQPARCNEERVAVESPSGMGTTLVSTRCPSVPSGESSGEYSR